MDLKDKLMQKNGIIAVTLAREFLSNEVGDRILTVAQLAEKYSTARGTIQSALKFLQDYEAISLEARGHLGTFITSINYIKLLDVADIKTILGVMPLPYSKVYEGLATGLYNTLVTSNISVGLAYMRGANTRVEALREQRYDFAVISKLAAQHYISEGHDIEIIDEFGDFTYVNEHILMFSKGSKNTIEDGMKIGIDYSSLDQVILTKYHCQGKNVEFVPLIYSQILNSILRGEIHAAIWNKDDLQDRDIKIPFKPINNSIFSYKDTNAVIVANTENSSFNTLLKKFINKEKVLDIQKKVINGEITPNY
ncbi:Helix-turn-helix domain-containing protein [Clostridium amylolyticum]|uniref:Helix-turn-helix domain-containing protein n=1 Tax=Clostridium amylolyticum TaxID=1121298 RepID=A0A1M6IFP0_9CLOT|nr:GntR family transcriptional regulator YhfZ [Clostridium amylolyticum]SHJ33136.1 Helix-turn-helix domain-containing protein [Clostridium amylolyticum]